MSAAELAAYIVACALAGVFVIAAAAKFRDNNETRSGFRALGVPAPALSATCVPAAEVAVSATLVLLPWVGAAVALGLLVLFTVFLAGRLRAGVSVPCNCFGSAGTAPLSIRDLFRNAMLAAGCVLVVALEPQPNVWLAGVMAVIAVTAVVVRRILRR